MQEINNKYGLQMKEWDDLHEWSVKSNSSFWEEVFKRYVFVVHSRSGSKYDRADLDSNDGTK